MRLEATKYLYDIQEATSRIVDFTSGKTLDDYRGNAMLRSAVERQFKIIGEALALCRFYDAQSPDLSKMPLVERGYLASALQSRCANN